MILEGFKIMVIGMSIVFLFLLIIIFMVSACSKIILKFSNFEQEPVAATGVAEKKGVIAAIVSSAIAKHISKKRDNQS